MSVSIPRLRPYIIYLERNQARLGNVQCLLSTVPGARLFPAVDGRCINFLVNQSRSRSRTALVTDHTKPDESENQSKEELEAKPPNYCLALGWQLIKHQPESRAVRGLRLGYGEAGCLLSHFYLWNHLAETLGEDEVGMILEDDAICQDPARFITSLGELPPLDSWEMCELFTTMTIRRQQQLTPSFYSGAFLGFNRAIAYLLTRGGARAIVSNVSSLDDPADDILSNLAATSKLRVIFPEQQTWNHLETHQGWESSMWETADAYLKVTWDRPINLHWVGVELGYWTGIGNQMFQWAAAKVQSTRLGMRLVVKAGPTFALAGAFPYIQAWQEWTAPAPFPPGENKHGPSLRTRAAVPAGEWARARVWKERSLAYDETIEELKVGTSWRLEGYLQNVRYLEPFFPLLRMVFAFDDVIQVTARSYLAGIRESLPEERRAGPLVAVHLRMPNAREEKLDEVCYTWPTQAFVYAAMDRMLAQFPTAHFVLCSNDPERARGMYEWGGRGVSWAELGVKEEMCLMSMCDHFILSASTFGWWSAVLNPSPTKQVIMCKPFFGPRDGHLNKDHDLILPGWTAYDMTQSRFAPPPSQAGTNGGRSSVVYLPSYHDGVGSLWQQCLTAYLPARAMGLRVVYDDARPVHHSRYEGMPPAIWSRYWHDKLTRLFFPHNRIILKRDVPPGLVDEPIEDAIEPVEEGKRYCLPDAHAHSQDGYREGPFSNAGACPSLQTEHTRKVGLRSVSH